jgi:hypothetical protein
MIFDFMSTPAAGEHDELAALIASENVSMAEFLDRFMCEVRKTDEGRAALQSAARNHQDIPIPEIVRIEMLQTLDKFRSVLTGAAKVPALK